MSCKINNHWLKFIMLSFSILNTLIKNCMVFSPFQWYRIYAGYPPFQMSSTAYLGCLNHISWRSLQQPNKLPSRPGSIPPSKSLRFPFPFTALNQNLKGYLPILHPSHQHWYPAFLPRSIILTQELDVLACWISCRVLYRTSCSASSYSSTCFGRLVEGFPAWTNTAWGSPLASILPKLLMLSRSELASHRKFR